MLKVLILISLFLVPMFVASQKVFTWTAECVCDSLCGPSLNTSSGIPDLRSGITSFVLQRDTTNVSAATCTIEAVLGVMWIYELNVTAGVTLNIKSGVNMT